MFEKIKLLALLIAGAKFLSTETIEAVKSVVVELHTLWAFLRHLEW
jgi:hypothetical protein